MGCRSCGSPYTTTSTAKTTEPGGFRRCRCSSCGLSVLSRLISPAQCPPVSEISCSPPPRYHFDCPGGDRPSSTRLKHALRPRTSLQSCVFTQCVRPRVERDDAEASSRLRRYLLPFGQVR